MTPLETTAPARLIARAEAVRRFQAAHAYTIVRRMLRKKDAPQNSDGSQVVGVRREIARVTSTGVYIVGGPGWAMTTFGPTGRDAKYVWHEHDDDRISLTIHHQWVGEWHEHLFLMYELEA